MCVLARIFFLLALLLLSASSSALSWRKGSPKDFSYFIYPIYGDIPGVGSTLGGGMTAANIFSTDMDTTLFYTRGGFDASGVALTSVHLIPNFFTVGGAYYSSRLPRNTYDRGAQSSRTPLFRSETSEDASVGFARIHAFDSRFHIYSYFFSGQQTTNRFFDTSHNTYANPDNARRYFHRWSLGTYLDLTDHWLDPRSGLFFEAVRKQPLLNDDFQSDYFTMEYNLQGYIPVGTRNTLALAAYSSQTVVTRRASTDNASQSARLSLNCSSYTDPIQQASCSTVEGQRLLDRTNANLYGRGVGLGGTQRLRSYPTGRFQGANSLFFGSEFRWNMTDVEQHWNLFFLKQIHTGLQTAIFAETGTVNDDLIGIYNSVFRSSFGAGLRILFAAAVVRLDVATGDEGPVVQFFFDYPWNISSIESI